MTEAIATATSPFDAARKLSKTLTGFKDTKSRLYFIRQVTAML
jgi:hypothetical protein